jgi:hypothetical protein
MHNCHRRFVAALALTLTLQASGLAQAPGKVESQLIQAEKDRFAAMTKVDAAALTRLLADDLTYVHSNANLQTKAQFIADLKSGDIKYVSIVPTEADWKVRIAGTTALVVGTAAVHVIDHGTDLTFRIRYTNVHVNRGGRWQMLAWQATKFPA